MSSSISVVVGWIAAALLVVGLGSSDVDTDDERPVADVQDRADGPALIVCFGAAIRPALSQAMGLSLSPSEWKDLYTDDAVLMLDVATDMSAASDRHRAYVAKRLVALRDRVRSPVVFAVGGDLMRHVIGSRSATLAFLQSLHWLRYQLRLRWSLQIEWVLMRTPDDDHDPEPIVQWIRIAYRFLFPFQRSLTSAPTPVVVEAIGSAAQALPTVVLGTGRGPPPSLDDTPSLRSHMIAIAVASLPSDVGSRGDGPESGGPVRDAADFSLAALSQLCDDATSPDDVVHRHRRRRRLRAFRARFRHEFDPEQRFGVLRALHQAGPALEAIIDDACLERVGADLAAITHLGAEAVRLSLESILSDDDDARRRRRRLLHAALDAPLNEWQIDALLHAFAHRSCSFASLAAEVWTSRPMTSDSIEVLIASRPDHDDDDRPVLFRLLLQCHELEWASSAPIRWALLQRLWSVAEQIAWRMSSADLDRVDLSPFPNLIGSLVPEIGPIWGRRRRFPELLLNLFPHIPRQYEPMPSTLRSAVLQLLVVYDQCEAQSKLSLSEDVHDRIMARVYHELSRATRVVFEEWCSLYDYVSHIDMNLLSIHQQFVKSSTQFLFEWNSLLSDYQFDKQREFRDQRFTSSFQQMILAWRMIVDQAIVIGLLETQDVIVHALAVLDHVSDTQERLRRSEAGGVFLHQFEAVLFPIAVSNGVGPERPLASADRRSSASDDSESDDPTASVRSEANRDAPSSNNADRGPISDRDASCSPSTFILKRTTESSPSHAIDKVAERSVASAEACEPATAPVTESGSCERATPADEAPQDITGPPSVDSLRDDHGDDTGRAGLGPSCTAEERSVPRKTMPGWIWWCIAIGATAIVLLTDYFRREHYR